MKKFRLVLIIILSILLSATAITAAEPLTDIKNNPYRSAIEQMVDFGILSGKGGGLFWPGDNLTRAEAAKVAMYLAGFDEDDAADALALPKTFNDVYVGMGAHEWAVGWINLAVKEGVINGYGDGTYGPGDNLTMAQWAAILIRVLGYETGEIEWPIGYDQLAEELGLTEDLVYVSRGQIKRDQMAKFSVNAMYNVVMPDGTMIKDRWENSMDDPPNYTEDPQLENMNISAVVTPVFLTEGGGKTATITVTLTDKTGKPIVGADVAFSASVAGYGDSNPELLPAKMKTDANGKAITSYTTRAIDDRTMVEINISAFKDSEEAHTTLAVMAANQAAIIQGVVKDPNTGAPMKDVHILFLVGDHDAAGWTQTDSQGHYSMVVPTGTYRVVFEMPIRDQITVKAANHGQTYTVDNTKGILKGVVTGARAGSSVMAIAPNYRIGSDDWTLQADVQRDGSFTLALEPNVYELYIVGSSTPFKTGANVQRGKVTNIGTVGAR